MADIPSPSRCSIRAMRGDPSSECAANGNRGSPAQVFCGTASLTSLSVSRGCLPGDPEPSRILLECADGTFRVTIANSSPDNQGSVQRAAERLAGAG